MSLLRTPKPVFVVVLVKPLNNKVSTSKIKCVSALPLYDALKASDVPRACLNFSLTRIDRSIWGEKCDQNIQCCACFLEKKHFELVYFLTKLNVFSINPVISASASCMHAFPHKCHWQLRLDISAGTIPAKSCSCDSDSFGLCGKESDSIRNRIRVTQAQLFSKMKRS
jgi:hypothetical protein